MHKLILLTVVVVIMLLLSCKSSTDPEETQPFKIQITLTNSAGAPLEGYRAAIYQKNHQMAGASRPECGLMFDMNNAYRVVLDITDYFGAPVKTLIDTQLAAGLHNFVWNGLNADTLLVRDGIYKVTAKYYQGDNLVYSDHIYAYLLAQPNIAVSPYVTDAQGKIVEEYKNPFPVLYFDQPLPKTNSQGDYIGDYVFSDSTKVLITDNQGNYRYALFNIKDGQNTLNLNWDAMTPTTGYRQAIATEDAVPEKAVNPAKGTRYVNKLYQNWPNPFN